MSVQSQIQRITTWRDRLTAKLQNLNLISSGTHTLQEDADAFDNFGFSLQATKTYMLGAADIDSSVLPDNGYNGMEKLEFQLDPQAINPAYIVSGSTILGVAGTAVVSQSLRRMSWNIGTVSNSSTCSVTLPAEYAYGTGSSTDPGVIPEFAEIALFRKSASASGYHTVDLLRKEASDGVCHAYLTDSSKNVYSTTFTYSYSNNGRTMTFAINNPGTNRFNGTYTVYMYY